MCIFKYIFCDWSVTGRQPEPYRLQEFLKMLLHATCKYIEERNG